MAVKVSNKLTSKQLIVEKIGDSLNSAQVTTAIIDNAAGKKPATKAALTKLFGNHLTTQNPYSKVYEADFIIILGTDQGKTVSASAVSVQ